MKTSTFVIGQKPLLCENIMTFNVFLFLQHVQVGLLNAEGYYGSLLTFIDQAVDAGFIAPAARHIIVSAPNVQELVRKLEVSH